MTLGIRISREQWSKLVNDDEHPLLNKAIQAQLAPGSTFKIIMATAGMQEGIAQNLHVNCGGGASFYGRYFRCWIAVQHHGHGAVDISKAIYQSCDVFFYTLAERLGIGTIAKYATAFGLGQKTGIDLPQEVTGVMPSEEWKIRNFKQKWYAGETISVGIGQGAHRSHAGSDDACAGAIASGGVMVRPHVTFPGDLPPNMVRASTVPDKVTIPIDPRNWENYHGRHGTSAQSRRDRGQRASARHRFCRQDGQRPDHQQRLEGEAGEWQAGLQRQRLVRGGHAAQES